MINFFVYMIYKHWCMLSSEKKILHLVSEDYSVFFMNIWFRPSFWLVQLIITMNFFTDVDPKNHSPWRVIICTKYISIITITKWVDSRHVSTIPYMHILMKIVLYSSFSYRTSIATKIPVRNVVHYLLIFFFSTSFVWSSSSFFFYFGLRCYSSITCHSDVSGSKRAEIYACMYVKRRYRKERERDDKYLSHLHRWW